MNLVIIEVRGGVVQRVISNGDIGYILIDHDNIDSGDELDISWEYPERVEKLHEAFSDDNSIKEALKLEYPC